MDRSGGALRARAGDLAVLVVAVAWGLLTARIQEAAAEPLPAALLDADLATGVVGCVALWWRRRFPVPIALALAGATVYSETVAGAAVLGLFTVAVHRPVRTTVAVCGTSLAALTAHQLLRPDHVTPPLTVFTIIGLGHLATVAWGLTVRSRRALVASLRERAAAAEVEARLRAERTEHEARDALAREMHDVLGHRLSLLSVHAGALSYARGAPPEDVARAAEVVRQNAHRALQDLRDVIGVLRAPVGELPLPAVEDVRELVDEARQAGTPVELRDDAGLTTGGQTLPETQGRTVYRLVQEGLTNVRKHAAGSSVTVRIEGRAGDHVTAEVVDTPPAGRSPGRVPPPPRSAVPGTGLRGLEERVRLVAGRLEHGPTDEGGWRVRIRLPWPL